MGRPAALTLAEVELSTEPLIAFFRILVRDRRGGTRTVMKRYAELLDFFDILQLQTVFPLSLPRDVDEVTLARDPLYCRLVQGQLDALLHRLDDVLQHGPLVLDFFQLGEEYRERPPAPGPERPRAAPQVDCGGTAPIVGGAGGRDGHSVPGTWPRAATVTAAVPMESGAAAATRRRHFYHPAAADDDARPVLLWEAPPQQQRPGLLPPAAGDAAAAAAAAAGCEQAPPHLPLAAGGVAAAAAAAGCKQAPTQQQRPGLLPPAARVAAAAAAAAGCEQRSAFGPPRSLSPEASNAFSRQTTPQSPPDGGAGGSGGDSLLSPTVASGGGGRGGAYLRSPTQDDDGWTGPLDRRRVMQVGVSVGREVAALEEGGGGGRGGGGGGRGGPPGGRRSGRGGGGGGPLLPPTSRAEQAPSGNLDHLGSSGRSSSGGGAGGSRSRPWCVVCMAKPEEVAVDPCGHLSMCEECASQVRQCPVCRGPIEKLLRVFVVR